MLPLKVEQARLRYHALLGTGGIGTGSFFSLDGNHTLGREESRTGRFLELRDYAKLHIICHYVQTLMGPGFATFPIGGVGGDEPGRRLCDEMVRAGLDIRYVSTLPHVQTMNCICIMYPDGSGGNLTVADSACAHVGPCAVRKAEPEFNRYKARGLALAVPEVPLAARDELLECATRYGFLRAASFTSAEMRDSSVPAMLNKTDLLVINRDEAASLASADAGASMERLAGKAVEHLTSIQPAIWAIMTAGREGSWAWDGRELAHLPALKVEAVNAAGAGDAFFAGVLAGLASGLALTEAQQLGNLCGAFSTTSPDTINHALDRASLARLAEQTNAALTGPVRERLGLS